MRWLATLLLGLGAPALAQPAATLTLGQARTMDHATLARHVLGLAGDTVVEHRIGIGEGGLRGVRNGVSTIRFATRPRPVFDGLCRAERITVGFEPLELRQREDPPVAVSTVGIDTLWGILPAQAGDGGGCASLGSVLASPERPGPYFVAQGPRQSDLTAVTIGRAIRLMRRLIANRGEGAEFLCQIAAIDRRDAREAACADRASAFGLLDTSRLSSLRVQPCRAGDRLCVTFHFADPGSSAWGGTSLVLILRLDADRHDELSDAHRVVHAYVGKEVWIV